MGNNMFAYCLNNSVNHQDSMGYMPTRRNTVFINDSTGGNKHVGTTNSRDLIQINDRNRNAVGKTIIQSAKDFKSSDSAQALSAANDIRSGVNNIRKCGELLFVPCPTIAEDLLGVGFFIYGVLQIAGGITKAVIWVGDNI